ncbi:prolipoprotein diacylglyceryl transferase [Candidatus Peregrinibacteria bacterium]|nr:MAG: prolipoprotein diacylglyceryl transferase [Candidatus Peregrinibacteria bacterium]
MNSFGSIPIGPLIIPTGGIVAFIGVLLASVVLIRTVRDEEVSLKFLSDHLFFFVVIPLFMGRLGAFLSLWSSLSYREEGEGVISRFQSFFLIGNGGIQADWALGGFFLVFILIALWRKEKFFVWLDTFILPGIVVSIFVSLGGYFSGWAYGRPAPDALPFPFVTQYDLLDVRYSGKIYAVQLYATIVYTLIFFIGWRLWQQKLWQRWPSGKFFAAMIFLLGIFTSILEFFRGDGVAMVGDIRLPQIFGVCISVAALLLFFSRKKKPLLNTISS